MITLAIRTDKPEAEIYLYENNTKLAEIKWSAHRELAETLHKKIQELLTVQGETMYSNSKNVKGSTLHTVERVAVYGGPGSFTGLRIGVSVANALAYGLSIPIVSGSGDNWIQECLESKIDKFTPVAVEYGSDPHITAQKK